MYNLHYCKFRGKCITQVYSVSWFCTGETIKLLLTPVVSCLFRAHCWTFWWKWKNFGFVGTEESRHSYLAELGSCWHFWCGSWWYKASVSPRGAEMMCAHISQCFYDMLGVRKNPTGFCAREWQLNASAVGNWAAEHSSGSCCSAAPVHGLMPIAGSSDLAGLPWLNVVF